MFGVRPFVWLTAVAMASSSLVAAASVVGHRPFSTSTRADAFRTSAFESLYSFGSGTSPAYGLSAVHGMLYGTLAPDQNTGFEGSIFEATTTGTVRELHRFTGPPDGNEPINLTADADELYGVTKLGGRRTKHDSVGCGTFFAVTVDGTENVRSPFVCDGGTGTEPDGKLLRYNGALLGTTELGGIKDNGSIFTAQVDGKLTHLFDFSGPDGSYPSGILVELNGAVYGTTMRGGSHYDGVIFTLSPNGTESVVFNFNGTDGAGPNGLVALDDTLYGVTGAGGAHNLGTVFAVRPNGLETILHSFSGKPDGAEPGSPLIAMDGALFGTTYIGGSSNVGSIFEISSAGRFKVLHSFDTTDGANPSGDLAEVGHTIYGTTYAGGSHGAGTLFALTP